MSGLDKINHQEQRPTSIYGSKQVINYIEKYGNTGLQLDAHSNGSQVVRNSVHALAQDKNNWGKYPNLYIHITEGAANVDGLDKDLANLQGREPNEVASKEIIYSSNQNDNVTSLKLLGNNPPTYSSFPVGKTNNWFMRWLNLKNSTSVHNTQGIGTKEAVEQGLRGNNRPEKGIGNRWNYDGIYKGISEVTGIPNISDKYKEQGVKK